MSSSTAFTNGSGLDISQLSFLVAGLGAVVVLLWMAWALTSLWRGWAGGRVRIDVAQYAAPRMILIVILIIWILT